ncbi:lysosomal cobalamin transporter ABCD4-like isoform X2 [Littorina saxatilis]|uniref:lysosomal cobalamin transporter ABCD4-like isoform X2 n=1 Tax=Littorina saxatilis TaxID=31220 RepID=UPI0038B539DF
MSHFNSRARGEQTTLYGACAATAAMVHAQVKFDLTFFKRFLKLCRWMFPSLCSKAAVMTLFLLLLSLLEQVVIYNIGLIASKYFKVLGTKDRQGFTTHTIISVVLIIAEAFLKSCITYVASMLHITWRQSLCTRLHHTYFCNILYYHVNVVDNTVDNPDQRMTQDVDKMTDTFSKVFVPIIISPFKIGYYMYQASIATGYIGPVSVLCFFMVFSLINKFLMTPVVHYVYKQERREGDFRFKHMQIRTYAESAAFYRAGQVEEVKTNQKLDQLIGTQRRLIHWNFALNFSINTADYLGSILSYIALAFPIFLGRYDNLAPADLSALISKNAFVCIYLINCFTTLIDQAKDVTDVAGCAHRIGQLTEVMGRIKADQEDTYDFASGTYSRHLWPDDSGSYQEMHATEPAFHMDGVTYGPPKSSTVLCRDLSVQLQTGVNVLVTGDSGCGKTSLLRVISGLWRPSKGRVNKLVAQGPSGVLYLPQKPYLTNGSLRDQILFPCTEAEVVPDDDKMHEYLSLVGLDQLLERLGGLDVDLDWNWYDELSPGEMQRLSFVRLFFHKPRFAMLDEATSQVSQEMESLLYNTCTGMHITLLSVGHRDSIRQFHHMMLHFDGTGSWTLTPTHSGDHGDSGSGGGDGGVVSEGAGLDSQHVQLSGVQASHSES